MECPDGLSYTKEHEWIRVENGTATVGITDFAQHELGDVVFVELPAVGAVLTKDQPFGVVESVKAVSDIYAPVSGTVIEINEQIASQPELVNQDPYGASWLVKLELADRGQLAGLMNADAYRDYTREKEQG
jgi:glycine cleavage system H protein